MVELFRPFYVIVSVNVFRECNLPSLGEAGVTWFYIHVRRGSDDVVLHLQVESQQRDANRLADELFE